MNNKLSLLNISSLVVAAVAHIITIIMSVMVVKYSKLAQGAILGAIGVLVCLLIIIDILLIFVAKTKDNKITIVAIVISVLMMVVGGIGTFALGKVNRTINNIIENDSGEQYETINGVISVYKNNKITEIKDLDGKKVGTLGISEASAATVGRELLEKEGINPKYTEFNMTSDLFEALVNGDIDAAIFSDAYRLQLTASEEDKAGFTSFLEDTTDIYEFSEKVKTATSESSKKDITAEPFTVLLLGFAPNQGGGGLTDSIILASINPRTLTATLTSIPRDSYVPISCYKNQRSKINEAGAASKACAMQTVSNLLDVDVDFYAEINFKGLVDIVDALGGIYINSPIEFTGQSSDTDRGDYNVWVPAGPYTANGEQALAFARERHHMPNGDFDRQIHQQEVITEIINSLLSLRDVNKALKVMDAAGDNLSTNMSLDQLISIFNYVINSNDVGGIDKFSLLKIRNSRLIGYTRWYYSYSMNLPLYGYYLYDGSIKENAELSDDTLGDFKTIDQDKEFKFFVYYDFSEGQIYHEEFDEARLPEDIPPFYPVLTNYTYEEAVAWANANGVTLNVRVLNPGDAGYIEGAEGRIVDQWPRYGALVADESKCTITIIGQPATEQEKVPNFVGKALSEVESWCKDHGYKLTTTTVSANGVANAGKVKSQSVAEGTAVSKNDSISVEVYDQPNVDTSSLKKGKTTKAEIETWCKNNVSSSGSCKFVDDTTSKYEEGILVDFTPTSGKANGTYTFKIAKKAATAEHTHSYTIKGDVVAPSKTTAGYTVYKCDVTGCTETTKKDYICESGYKLDSTGKACEVAQTEHTHSFTIKGDTVTPSGTTAGYTVYKCDVTGCTETTKKEFNCESGYKLDSTGKACEVVQETTDPCANGHDYSEELAQEVAATCTTSGTSARMKCSRCDSETGGTEIPALGHDFQGEEGAKVCSRCQATE